MMGFELQKEIMGPEAELITVMMGLGHYRAAHALLPVFAGRMSLCGSRQETPAKEYRLWKRARRMYYRLSRAGQIPWIGPLLKKVLTRVEQIEPYYPIKDLSRPTLPVHFLHRMISKKGLGRHMVDQLMGRPHPTIHTFYATAIAMDQLAPSDNNYLLITDSDFNRVWVPHDPANSRIQYLAPCTQVKRRLLSYGVPENKIHLSGFPLPIENIGSPQGLEVLREDLRERLVRLDPSGRFANFHQPSVEHWLGKRDLHNENNGQKRFTLTFAIGGAGAQVHMVEPILISLGDALRQNRIRLFLSAGIAKRVFETILASINRLGLAGMLGDQIQIIYHDDPAQYCSLFNRMLRQTDVLWTKPSELSFYCALGIPILLAPSIGPHESLNKKWLREVHAAVSPPGPVECCHQWLFDLLETGRLAEAAWDGFLKGRKMGSYNIRTLVQTGKLPEADSPLSF